MLGGTARLCCIGAAGGSGAGVMCRIVRSHLASDAGKALTALGWHNRGSSGIFFSVCVASPHGLSSTMASGEPEFLQVSSGLPKHRAQKKVSQVKAILPFMI